MFNLLQLFEVLYRQQCELNLKRKNNLQTNTKNSIPKIRNYHTGTSSNQSLSPNLYDLLSTTQVYMTEKRNEEYGVIFDRTSPQLA